MSLVFTKKSPKTQISRLHTLKQYGTEKKCISNFCEVSPRHWIEKQHMCMTYAHLILCWTIFHWTTTCYNNNYVWLHSTLVQFQQQTRQNCSQVKSSPIRHHYRLVLGVMTLGRSFVTMIWYIWPSFSLPTGAMYGILLVCIIFW